MRTFFISTLGCKVNQYEGEQLAAVLRARGLRMVDRAELADLRVVNTCSVTVQAASKSRQTARQVVRLPVLRNSNSATNDHDAIATTVTPTTDRQRLVITGCWATSDKAEAQRIPGVSAVLTHHDDVAGELRRLLDAWQSEDRNPPAGSHELTPQTIDSRATTDRLAVDEGWMKSAGADSLSRAAHNRTPNGGKIKKNPAIGTTRLPLLGERQAAHTRAFLKVQDGCDAHCTYCIIPTLRPRLWSKPVEDLVDEARRMVDAGHAEVVLTGIFLGAFGQPTALRRRQGGQGGEKPLASAIDALCTRVPGLRRLRLSSLEPGDLDDRLLDVLCAHEQVVPHFHLPLQSGSDDMLRRMNRQYGRDDYLRMIARVHGRFDRPAVTTDVIVGFPGETDDQFARTVDVVQHARFIHVHAFPFSPRPGTAAARWTRDFVHGPVVNERIDRLREMADQFSLAFRQSFLGESVEVIVERPGPDDGDLRHGRTGRYFDVWFEGPGASRGDVVNVTVDRVTATRTHGSLA